MTPAAFPEMCAAHPCHCTLMLATGWPSVSLAPIMCPWALLTLQQPTQSPLPPATVDPRVSKAHDFGQLSLHTAVWAPYPRALESVGSTVPGCPQSSGSAGLGEMAPKNSTKELPGLWEASSVEKQEASSLGSLAARKGRLCSGLDTKHPVEEQEEPL